MAKTVRDAVFRGDIQGLRALAVGLVVLYHLWPTHVTGGFIGVDVFFVISGFLITSHLVRNPPRSFKDVRVFWIRRVKRLLPASFLVLFATLVGILLLAPDTVWIDWSQQVLASTFYVQNWALAATSVDYLAADNAVSAVQHFWSLSVEEQFYLFWPLIIGILFFLAAKAKAVRVSIPLLGVAVILVLSLSYSIFYTSVDPGIAYFSTLTRGWELAAGGLLALLPKATGAFRGSTGAAAIGWFGLAAVVLAALAYDGSTPFPSYTAALPVVGTAAVIWVHAEGRWSPAWLLGSKPSRFLGDHSYSIYLWHWPLIVLLPFAVGRLAWPGKLGVISLSILLAMATKTFVEDRFRKKLDTSTMITGGRFLLVGSLSLGLLSGGFLYMADRAQSSQSDVLTMAREVRLEVGKNCFGGAAMVNNCPPSNGLGLVPTPLAAKTDKSQAYADGCWSEGDFSKRPICTYGNGPTKVALVGNSHAGHWLPTLQEIAKDRGWTISTFLASRCVATGIPTAFGTEAGTRGCLDYGQWVLDKTAHGQFDLIVSSDRLSLPVQGMTMAQSVKPAEKGHRDFLAKWSAGGTPIVVIRDNPFPGNTVPNIPDCIAGSRDPMADCSGTPKSWYQPDPVAAAAKALHDPDIHVVDMSGFFCTKNSCPPIIGSVIVYFDSSHITATYSRTLAPFLERKIEQVVGK
ncbi:acyltransferase family protein [Paeniglutamicibacter cryotolerans]|uniref:Peptidoglycan/LPS O-acetylase OafA/YrhL n=1 Tax=Paeniglutamicibacter cryotolerans TaxID=670079 RepID=A0A839QMC9_9MICC|nr:acyltransferase family protein [Paeniglutamicibacter cryotolerans]MBB2997399.1 peptidoglycan/LPS O-acetylase OafA/YrhL [Paeniglutamicibacter cryotolerans]